MLAYGQVALQTTNQYFFKSLWSPEIADPNNKVNQKTLNMQQRGLQKRIIKTLISNGANIQAMSAYWGTPTDVAAHFGNLTFWVNTLREMGFDTDDLQDRGDFARRPQKVRDTYAHHTAAVRNRLVIDRKVSEFWNSIGSWDEHTNVRRYSSSPLDKVATSPESTRSRVFRARGDYLPNVPWYQIFLLELLSGEYVESDSMVIVLDAGDNCMHSAWPTWICHHSDVRHYATSVCTQSEYTHLRKCISRQVNKQVLLPQQTMSDAFLKFCRGCQAKAFGKWTTAQEEALRATNRRIGITEQDLERCLHIIIKIASTMAWTDEIMGWDGSYDPYKIEGIPGQWRD